MAKKERRYFITVNRLQRVPHLHKQITMMEQINPNADIHVPRDTDDFIRSHWDEISAGNAICVWEHGCSIPNFGNEIDHAKRFEEKHKHDPKSIAEYEMKYLTRRSKIQAIFDESHRKFMELNIQDKVFTSGLKYSADKDVLRRIIERKLIQLSLKQGISDSVDNGYTDAHQLLTNKNLDDSDRQDIADRLISLHNNYWQDQHVRWGKKSQLTIRANIVGTLGHKLEELKVFNTNTISFLLSTALDKKIVEDRYSGGQALRNVVLEAYDRKLLVKAPEAIYVKKDNEVYLPNVQVQEEKAAA